jgi:uncharacterized membrane protein
MLLAMFRRHLPEGNWYLPLISGLAVLILAAAAVYFLSSLWRERADGVSDLRSTADHEGASAFEILDRRLAAGEITLGEYEEIAAAIARRRSGAAAAANGAATAAV